MFFPDCEHLAGEEPDLREQIRLVDNQLSTFSPNATIQPKLLAASVDVDEEIADAILVGLTKCGLLKTCIVIQCPRCSTLLADDAYSHALENNEALECSACTRQITNPECNRTAVYHFSERSKEYLANRVSSGVVARRPADSVGAIEPKVQVVLLIHGIRTAAAWQGMVRQALQRQNRTVVYPLKYGYLDVLRFWFPLWTRRGAIDELLYKVRHAIADHPAAELSIVAHSFGTYAITEILRENADIRPRRMVLCGSIVRRRFRWDRLPCCPQTINDCGSRDIWPILAQSTTWGYGATGTFGFGFPGIKDRYHDMAHSDFFTRDFVETFWLPWLHEGQYIESVYEVNQPPTPLWRALVSVMPFKYGLLTALIVMVVWIAFRVAASVPG